MGREPLNIDYVRERVKNGAKLCELAEDTGWSSAYISIKCKENNIILDAYGKQRKTGRWDNPEWLNKQHWDKKRSIARLAKKIGISSPRLLKRFKYYEIPVRSNNEANRLKSSKVSKITKQLWKSDSYRESYSKSRKLLWSDDAYRNKMKKVFASPKVVRKLSEASKKKWNDENYRNKMINSRNSTSVKEKIAIGRAKQKTKDSSIELIFESILIDLGIKYEKQYRVGFYLFDFFLIKHNTLVECQGDYWHSLKDTIKSDRAKSTYVSRYFSYNIKYVWEHEFKCKEKIINLVKYWCGLKQYAIQDFKFDDIIIRNVDLNDAKLFLSKYHYIGPVGSGQIRYGAYINDKLIALSVFGNITRKESANRLGLSSKQVKELRRFCIHPHYHKKNFASWFLSRSMRRIMYNTNAKCLLTFADSTFGHEGTIYKATNWTFDGITKPSYWYVDEDGYVMHKKTLYNHAISLKMTEKEFADQHNYTKIHGMKKYRFIYKIS